MIGRWYVEYDPERHTWDVYEPGLGCGGTAALVAPFEHEEDAREAVAAVNARRAMKTEAEARPRYKTPAEIAQAALGDTFTVTDAINGLIVHRKAGARLRLVGKIENDDGQHGALYRAVTRGGRPLGAWTRVWTAAIRLGAHDAGLEPRFFEWEATA